MRKREEEEECSCGGGGDGRVGERAEAGTRGGNNVIC